jgi:hypothetical protein
MIKLWDPSALVPEDVIEQDELANALKKVGF